MLEQKAYRYRLTPTPEQAHKLSCFVGVCRTVYNLALEQRRDWYRPGRSFSFAAQCRELTALREAFDWMREAPVHPMQQALRDVERAYQNFFSGRAQYPTPRKKGLHDTLRFPDPKQLSLLRTGRQTGMLKLPKLGRVSLRGWRALPEGAELRNVTVSREGAQWYAAVQWQREVPDPVLSRRQPVGIDRGITVFAALSNDACLAPLNAHRTSLARLARAQRRLARKVRYSANWHKAKRRVTKILSTIADQRRDYLHKQSTTIANSHGLVVIEDLKVRNMSASARGTVEAPGRNVRQKAGLNRAILDQGWHMFETMLDYKLRDRGGELRKVPAPYTSQTCSACWHVDKANRTSQATFACVACRHSENADTNAAKTILRLGIAADACEGSHWAPNEAGTTRRLAA